MEVEVRLAGAAGVADEPEPLAALHPLARPDADAAGLQVGIQGESTAA
jgi:hypothetical protein